MRECILTLTGRHTQIHADTDTGEAADTRPRTCLRARAHERGWACMCKCSLAVPSMFTDVGGCSHAR
eukprot:8979862-Alexandrium_andersonii.AAC.1